MLSSKLVVRLTIHGDKDRRLEVGPWSLDLVAYAVAVLLRGELACHPFGRGPPKARASDVLVVDDLLAVSRRDVVSAAVVRNRENFVEQLVRLRFARARACSAGCSWSGSPQLTNSFSSSAITRSLTSAIGSIPEGHVLGVRFSQFSTQGHRRSRAPH